MMSYVHCWWMQSGDVPANSNQLYPRSPLTTVDIELWSVYCFNFWTLECHAFQQIHMLERNSVSFMKMATVLVYTYIFDPFQYALFHNTNPKSPVYISALALYWISNSDGSIFIPTTWKTGNYLLCCRTHWVIRPVLDCMLITMGVTKPSAYTPRYHVTVYDSPGNNRVQSPWNVLSVCSMDLNTSGKAYLWERTSQEIQV